MIREAEAAGIEDVLIKPVGASILFDTLIHLLGAKEGERRERPEVEAQARDESGTLGGGSHESLAGAHILLVEDNELNQEVATEILKSAGCEVSLARDGAEAVAKVSERAYDLVLMDMQMPVMDGLTATREIRKLQGLAGLPVIAMTANAMAEGREQCLAAGMNDYIVKPIDPDAMFDTLRRYYPKRRSSTILSETSSPADVPPGTLEIAGVDTAQGLRRVIGNRALYIDLLHRFTEGQRDAVKNINEALDRGDRPLAERIAHTLKGIAGNLGAKEVQTVAGELEAAIRGARPSAALSEISNRLSSTLSIAIGHIESGLAGATPAALPAKETEASEGMDGSTADLIAKLLLYIEESDAEALDFLESARGRLLATCDRDSVERLVAALRNYDFSTALGIAKSLGSAKAS